MNIQKYNMSSYNINIIRTDKFKTVNILVSFRDLLKKESITMRSFLQLLLFQSSKKYPTHRLLNIETEKLYGLELYWKRSRFGKYGLMSFGLTMINEKYTEKGMLNKSLDFLFEVLFNPNVENGAFDTKSFNIVKNVFTSDLKSIKDDTGYYSMVRMQEEMDKNSPISYRGGYLEDIDKINEQNLYTYYQEVMKTNLVDIYVIGDIDSVEIKRMFRDKFKNNTIKKEKADLIIKHQKYRLRIKKILEKEHIKQSKLAIGCKNIGMTDFERKYVVPLYTHILGGSGYSKLFQNVREKNSLAYTVGSTYRQADNLLLISAGINKEKFNKTLKIIREQMNDMIKGNITDEEMENAKQSLISILKHIEDVPQRILDSYVSIDLLKTDNLNIREKNIMKVTKEDIKKAAKKVKMDTVLLLYGDEKDEENND